MTPCTEPLPPWQEAQEAGGGGSYTGGCSVLGTPREHRRVPGTQHSSVLTSVLCTLLTQAAWTEGLVTRRWHLGPGPQRWGGAETVGDRKKPGDMGRVCLFSVHLCLSFPVFRPHAEWCSGT